MEGICSFCKKPCFVNIVDFGIGQYEYWGASGVDTQLAVVSTCCEAPVFEEENSDKYITVSDVLDYNSSYK
jgi:hypothetical protein